MPAPRIVLRQLLAKGAPRHVDCLAERKWPLVARLSGPGRWAIIDRELVFYTDRGPFAVAVGCNVTGQSGRETARGLVSSPPSSGRLSPRYGPRSLVRSSPRWRSTEVKSPSHSLPTATYRWQLHAHLRFEAAAALVPYLAELGIGAAYTSPFLRACRGSTHGYDVVDHGLLDPELVKMLDWRD